MLTDTENKAILLAKSLAPFVCVDVDGRVVNKEHSELKAGQPDRTETRIDLHYSHQPAANSHSAHQVYRLTHSETKLLLP